MTHSHHGPDEYPLHAPPPDLCLAFANTRYWRGTEKPTEELASLGDLLAWCSAHGASPGVVRGMKDRAWSDGAAPPMWLAEAIDLREAVARLFAAMSQGLSPGKGDIATLDGALAAAPGRSRVAWTKEGFAWLVGDELPGVPALLAPVLWSAADLLTGTQVKRVRRCGNDRCLWLFLDDSKSGNRRWCSMSACGNRAKAHRHRLRHAAADGAREP